MSTGLRNQFAQFGGMGSGSSYPDPFNDIASLAVPTNMRSALYWCMPPGTLVETATFDQVPIEKITKSTRVPTRGGTTQKVKTTSVRRHTGELVGLSFAGFGKTLPQQMTPEHKVWCISTAKLKPGRVAPKAVDAVRVEAKDVVIGDYVATPILRLNDDATPRFSGWLLGLYIAKGCPTLFGNKLRGVRFTLGADDETNGVLSRLLLDATDSAVEAYTPPSRADARLVTLNDVELPDWFLTHGGRYSTGKKLSEAVTRYGKEFVKELIAGWIDGDGRINNYRLHVQTSSKVLAYQMVRLANAVGFTPDMIQIANDKGYGDANGKPAYALHFDKTDSAELGKYGCKGKDLKPSSVVKRHGCFIEGDYVYRRVLDSTTTPYDGPVYNFEVENDHSYIANGVLTSNCEYIFSTFGTYRMAMERVISYFLTDIDVIDASDDEVEKWTAFHDKTLNTKTLLQNMLRNRACYGNSFASVVRPFVRFLTCPKCGYLSPLREVHGNAAFAFNYRPGDPDKAFCATCPACKVGSGYSGPWTVKDEDDDTEKKLKVKIWNPHEIEILHDTYTDDTAYLWRIPEDYKKQLRSSADGRGNLFALERAPKEVMRAVAKNQMYRFNPDAVFHMKEPTLAGIYNRGWGLPRIISNFRQIWYVQVLRRFNEAIALDYVIPFRIITPAPAQGKSGGGLPIDPMSLYNGGDFRSQVNAMIRRRRRDPANLHVLPFPVNFQMFGADANQLAPRDLLDQGMETLLNDSGAPIELYNGSLQLQTAPVALRLFESTWHHLVHDANFFLDWLDRQISQIMSWETVTCTLKRVTVADNLEKQMMAAQLMMSQQLSGTTVLGDLGYKWKKEQQTIADESRFQSEMQTRVQEEMDQAGFAQQIAKGQGGDPNAQQGGGQPQSGGGQQGGGQQGGGQPQPGMGGQSPVTQYLAQMNPSTPVTPQEMMQVADSLASELMGLPESVKNSELRKLKQYNQALHALVKSRMDQKRQDTRSSAGNAALGQMQQQSGGGGAPPQ